MKQSKSPQCRETTMNFQTICVEFNNFDVPNREAGPLEVALWIPIALLHYLPRALWPNPT